MANDHEPRLQKSKHLLQYVGLPVVLLTLWQALSHLGFIKPLILPPPSQVALTFWDLTKSGELPRDIGISMIRVLEGFGIALFLGLGIRHRHRPF